MKRSSDRIKSVFFVLLNVRNPYCSYDHLPALLSFPHHHVDFPPSLLRRRPISVSVLIDSATKSATMIRFFLYLAVLTICGPTLSPVSLSCPALGGAMAFTLVPSRLPLAVTPLFGGKLRLKSITVPRATSTSQSLSGDDDDGGTAWMREAMASIEVGSICDPTDFTRGELDNMEKLIVSLSMESDDNKRRQKLDEILDKELVGALNAESCSQGDLDIPRFARLFQMSLDSVGESVQNAARVSALETQKQHEKRMAYEFDAADAENSSEVDGLVRPEKSQEELQLWALIDMMVQSKTRVKLHMGSLGGKGNFR
jgi:hypothetical protein